MSLDKLADLSNVGSLAAFAIVCATVIYLRRAAPNLERPFRTPLLPVVPILGALMCGYLMLGSAQGSEARPLFSISFTTAQFFGVYLVLGLIVYFSYSMWNSKLAKGITVTGHEPDPDLAATGKQTDTIR